MREMDMALSFKMTIILRLMRPALLRPSYARPPVNAPSPMTAMTWPGSPASAFATERPSAEEMDALLCPVVNGSQSLSSLDGKPESPSSRRSVENASSLPVKSLCA